MKNIFTLLIGGLLTTSAFANNITINFSGNRDFQVLVDGRNVNSYGGYSNSNSIYLNDLRPGQHSLEVYRTARRNKGWGNENGPVYSSNFTVSPQYDLNITIDDWGKVQIYENRTNGYGRNDDRRNNRGYDDRDRDRGRDWNNNYSRAMNERSFNQLVERIRRQWFGKMSTAREAVSSNYFATYQVRQILQIFSSERDRLELARIAYPRTVDQQNFRQIYDMFSYQGQAELDRIVRSERY